MWHYGWSADEWFVGRVIVLLALLSAYWFLLAAILFFAVIRSLCHAKPPQ